MFQRNLPARARVIKQRVPNAYDNKALRLEVSTAGFPLHHIFVLVLTQEPYNMILIGKPEVVT